MPRFRMRRQGYLVIVESMRVVGAGVCERMNHEIRFDRSSLNVASMKARDIIISEFMIAMNGKEYTPDGPTIYCANCQEDCAYKGMEEG